MIPAVVLFLYDELLEPFLRIRCEGDVLPADDDDGRVAGGGNAASIGDIGESVDSCDGVEWSWKVRKKGKLIRFIWSFNEVEGGGSASLESQIS